MLTIKNLTIFFCLFASPLAAAPVLAPMQWVYFDIQAEKIAATGKVGQLNELWAVNELVNILIIPKMNKESDHRFQVWPHFGECGDYAVTKRHELLKLGWPSSTLLLTEVIISNGEYHLVLVVRFKNDHLILDNLTSKILSPEQTGYTFVKTQNENNPNFWQTYE